MPCAIAQASELSLNQPNSTTAAADSIDLDSVSSQRLLSPENVHFSVDRSDLSSTLPAPADAVINVENLQPVPIDFETSGTTLEGIEERTAPVDGLPAIAPLELDDNVVDAPEPIDPRQVRETVPYEIEDYIAEPTATPILRTTAEIPTPPAEFVEWRATLWGGAMTNNEFNEVITFRNIELEDSGLFGIGINRTLTGGNSLKIEGELQLLRHFGRQDHYEATAALALRWLLSPSFSIALLEGVSYATALPEIEDENNSDESHFLNYLAIEIEYLYTPKWAIAGRLHHRSGAYGQFGDATGGSNAYIMGLRHRF